VLAQDPSVSGRLNGDSRDFTATHKRLLTAEVAERLNIVKPAVLSVKFFDVIAAQAIVAQFLVPPIIDDTLFSQFVEAIKSQEIIFFSQFPMEKVSVLDRKSDYMIDDLKIIKPEASEAYTDKEQKRRLLARMGKLGLAQAHEIQDEETSLLGAVQKMVDIGGNSLVPRAAIEPHTADPNRPTLVAPDNAPNHESMLSYKADQGLRNAHRQARERVDARESR